MPNKELSERVRGIQKKAIIIDMLEAWDGPIEEKDLGYFQTCVDAGITAVNFTIPGVAEEFPTSIEQMAHFLKLMESVKCVKIVRTVADIESAKKEGKIAVIMGMQNSRPFERNLDLIRIFAMLGIKVADMAYSEQNYLGAGCVEPVDCGLTNRGKQAVKELNRLGILIDVSHSGNKTGMETAKASKSPIAITHATSSALVEMSRAKTEDTLKAVAENGGVIGQVIYRMFCERRDKMGVRPTMSDYVDFIDYLVNLVGIDHVGLGLDPTLFGTQEIHDEFWEHHGRALVYPHEPPPFDELYVQGFDDIRDMPKVIEELFRHGYSDDEVTKIVGGNWIRLLKEVWK